MGSGLNWLTDISDLPDPVSSSILIGSPCIDKSVADPGRGLRGLKPPLSDLYDVRNMNYGERITVDDVARAFVEKNPRRLFDASLFTADEKHYN